MRMIGFGASAGFLAFAVTLGVISWMSDDASARTQAAAMQMPTEVLESAIETPVVQPAVMDTAQMHTPEMHAAMMAEEGTQHEHALLDIAPDSPIPTVTHLVFPDAMDGYNLQILTENFTFTPAAINRENAANEGHAHLYVNGEKISRIYSNWAHLPSDVLVPGVNIVTVTLNANDHSEWAFHGVPIASNVRVIVPTLASAQSN